MPIIFVALALAVWLTLPSTASRQPAATSVTDAAVLAIAQKHCVSCHGSKPDHPAFPVAPKGVVLESAAQLRRYGPLIVQHTVRGNTMPLGNTTGMTSEERVQLGIWLEQAGHE